MDGPTLAELAPAASPAAVTRRAWATHRAPAVAALAVIVLAVLAGLAVTLAAPHGAAKPGRHSDAALYAEIIGKVRAGHPYYPAAAETLRADGYPLMPWVNIRPPLVAEAMAALPDAGARVLACRLLVLAVILAFVLRLRPLLRRPVAYVAALLIAGFGFAAMAAPNAWLFHETWAGLLIALSLAVHGRSPARWIASVVLGLTAVLCRELAAPFLLAMGAVALFERRRGEALAWATALAAFAGACAIHAHLATAQILPGDAASPSWLAAGGPRFVLATAGWNGLFALLPKTLVAILAPLAVAGLFGWPVDARRRLVLVVCGYMAAFTVIGRPDNDYWGLIYAALLTLGLPFTLPVISRLWRGAVPGLPPETPTQSAPVGEVSPQATKGAAL